MSGHFWWTQTNESLRTADSEFQTDKLNNPDITDEEIQDAILNGEHKVEITEKAVASEIEE